MAAWAAVDLAAVEAAAAAGESGLAAIGEIADFCQPVEPAGAPSRIRTDDLPLTKRFILVICCYRVKRAETGYV